MTKLLYRYQDLLPADYSFQPEPDLFLPSIDLNKSESSPRSSVHFISRPLSPKLVANTVTEICLARVAEPTPSPNQDFSAPIQISRDQMFRQNLYAYRQFLIDFLTEKQAGLKMDAHAKVR
ncbi:unnamed protein product [Protopolystoma xenopodis]|uniref:Uncharacterized protein n=1 Tax=Protopolystoma xenopodis TaxID=117903 RepID=A0A3S5CUR9_9PLAT|nr:unnamed protein product [Protopolystoma xenopodis]